jgi:hypothetical protein
MRSIALVWAVSASITAYGGVALVMPSAIIWS